HVHGDGVQDAEPALSDRIRHGLFFPADRQIAPDSVTAGRLANLGEVGVVAREHTRVTRVVRPRETGTAGVTGHADVIRAEALVIAAGVPSAGLLGELGQRVPIYSGKGYSIDYSPAPFELRTSLTLEDARVAVTPLNGMLRLAGTME